LFILGFAAVALLGTVLSEWLLIPDYPGDLGMYSWDKWNIASHEEQEKAIATIRGYVTDSERDSILASVGEYDPKGTGSSCLYIREENIPVSMT